MSEVARLERLLWTMMRAFERQTLAAYQAHVPALATDEKKAFVARLDAAAADDGLAGTPLAGPIESLLGAARSADAPSTLIVQGLILEQLGRVIYERAHEAEGVSLETKALADAGKAQAAAIAERAPDLVEQQVGRGDALFAAFTQATAPVFARLDALGEAVDAVFGPKFDIHFADLMGDVTAEVLPVCTGLGVERRKLIIHLTGALMKSA